MAQATTTPGYNLRLEIWFQTDKRGRKTAWHFSRQAFRAVRIGLDEAELFIATGQADEYPGHPFKP